MTTASREIEPTLNPGTELLLSRAAYGEVSVTQLPSMPHDLGDMRFAAEALMDQLYEQPAPLSAEAADPGIPAADSVVQGEVLSRFDVSHRGDKLGRFVGSYVRGAEQFVTTKRAIATAVLPWVFIPVPSCDLTRFDVPPGQSPQEWDRKHLKKRTGGTAGNQGNASVCSGPYPFGDLKKQIERRQKCSGKSSSGSSGGGGGSSSGGGGGNWNGNCDVFPPFSDLAGRQAYNRNC